MYLDFLEFPNLMCFIFVSVWVNLKKNVVNDHQVMGVRNLYTTYIKTGTVYIFFNFNFILIKIVITIDWPTN